MSSDCHSKSLADDPHAANGGERKYLTTPEAADYLRISVSRLMRIGDLPYLRGRPNLYAREDLDDWFQRNKYDPFR